MKKAFPLLLFLFCAHRSLSQTDSLAKPAFTRLPDIFYQVKENHLREDTVLDDHFNYFKSDFNGSLGLPSQELILENKTPGALGLRYFVPNYRQHFFTEEDVAFYQTKKPYTRAFALIGQRQEQILKLTHSQTIRKQFSYAIKFNRYKHTGFYKSQTAINDNFMASTHYITKNKRYSVKFWALYNKLRHNENGGITYDSLLGEFLNESKELIDINLTDARRATRNLNTSLMQHFKLNKGNDSAGAHYLFHSFSYANDYYVYADPRLTTGFYENIFIDSTETRDSAYVKKYINSVGYNFQSAGSIKKDFYVQYRNEIAKARQYYVLDDTMRYNIDSAVMNHFAGGGLHFGNSHWNANAFAEYVVAGANMNDFKAGMNVVTDFNSKNTFLNFSLNTEQRTPDLFYSHLYGNHFQWTSTFLEKVSTTKASGILHLFKGRLNIESQTRFILNYIWFQSPTNPSQYLSNVVMSRNGIGARLKFWRFRFNPKLDYQYNSNSDIISMPAFIASAQLYYEARLFKNNLHLQAGFQASYYSEFESNAYMPATNSYYVSGRKTVGEYPFADFFISAEIKPVRFFVKVDHVNQGLTGSNYILTPNYPMPDRAFKFGFTWLFWD